MIEKKINIEYNTICHNLSKRKLKPAFNLLEKIIAEYGLLLYNNECKNLEQTYHYMLKYTVEGINDPERQKVYRHLIVSVFLLTDKVYESLRLKYSTSVEYQKKRGFEKLFIKNPDEFSLNIDVYYNELELKSLIEEALTNDPKKTELAKIHQQQIISLFYHLWFRDELFSGDIKMVTDLLKKAPLQTAYKALIISALTLSLIRYFDIKKISLLFDVIESDNEELKQRALVGLLIIFFKYDNRLVFFPELTGRLTLLSETKLFKKNLEQIILQFIRTKETEKIQQKIKDEIIPEMIKISPNLSKKINLDSLMEEGLTDDKNPEWEDIFKDSPGLMNKMEEFSELQMEGADVFLSSFSMLKSFPFFSEIANWFIPFFSDNPVIGDTIDISDMVNAKFMETIKNAPILCNSDKHSFCFSLGNIPEENREMMAEAMKAEMDQFDEIEKDEELTAPEKKTEFISNQYIQDLYRFYKLHPQKNDFEDIFSWRFDFHNQNCIGEILKEDRKLLRNIAEYYFEKNHFVEASEIYNILLKEEQSGELYQKIAFCHQKQGNYSSALESYLKAELYELNKLWNLKKIALCYRNLKEPFKALDYYKLAEQLNPDNLGIQLSIGHCLLELDKYEDALKCYFKVEYLSPGNKKVWRPIGWCSFLTGKTKQAEKYFLKLTEDDPTKYDLMNMGHVQWQLGKRKQALNFYKRSIKETGFTEPEFLEVFEEDLHHLLNQGINNDDVPIILDQLRYLLEE